MIAVDSDDCWLNQRVGRPSSEVHGYLKALTRAQNKMANLLVMTSYRLNTKWFEGR